MALSHSPSIVTNGLVLCLDAANRKGYDKFENLMTSSQLGNAILNDGGAVTVTTDTTIASPFGGSDGVLKCVHTTQTPGYFRRGQNMSLTAGVTYTFSFYFKNGTVSNPYGQGVNSGPSILVTTFTPTFQEFGQSLNTNIDVGNGWYRQVYTFTPSYTQTYQVDFNQSVNQSPIGTYYLYGFQLEIGSSVTDYYATTSTAKNRGTILSDLSGRGNTGTLTNGVGYGNSNSGSFVFDGTNDYVDFPGTASGILDFGTGNFSLCCWIKPGSGISGDGIINKRFGGGRGYRLDIYSSQGIRMLVVGDAAVTVTANQIYNVGTWYYVVGVAENNTLKLYINSTLQNQTATYSGTLSNFSVLEIGRMDTDNQYSLDASVAQVSIYNRALTAAEVQQNFNALRGRFGI